MTHDVEFTINTGDHKGKVYKYTLAMNQGAKMWGVTPKFFPPPSMRKEKIEMVILAREANISLTGAVELQHIQEIMKELSAIAEETDVTLKGLDYQPRPILIDQEGFSQVSIADEQGKSSEYRVSLTCWGLYE